ncbi:hypothetical protein BDV24DRAFT_139221 [Aspergillus arachidicola]|uniref:Uncharacterized protein n=1 Tax=Aspergillus arachidicola TaxID=656916 RepID=A0A5N6XXB5_9EURO|nr:hypothetical protein BDV24DRAFT_139221 [Aspergillus arachidicola]
MESKHNTRKDSDRVRLRDDDTGSTEPEQVDQQSSFADLDPTKQYTASSQTTGRSFQPAAPRSGSSYHFKHDDLAHPDEEFHRPQE